MIHFRPPAPARRIQQILRASLSYLLFGAVLVVSAVLPSPATAKKDLVLGIHPYLPPAELQQVFTPLVRELEEHLGLSVSLSIAENYDSHIRAVGHGKVDIAFLGPASYVQLVRQHGPHPLLARLEVNGSPLLSGVIFVADKSPIKRLEQLRGKRFAFCDRESTMGYLVPLFMLERAGVAPDSLAVQAHLSDHENVVLGVLTGDFDAGAAKDDIFDRYRPQGLRSLAVSPPVSEHVFVARKKLASDMVSRVRDVLLHLADDPAGAQTLRSIRADATALVPVADRDYDRLRTMLDAVAPGGQEP